MDDTASKRAATRRMKYKIEGSESSCIVEISKIETYRRSIESVVFLIYSLNIKIS